MKYSVSTSAVICCCSMMAPALAFTPSTYFQQSPTSTAFLGAPISNSKLQQQQPSHRAATLKMDVEEPFLVSSSSTNSQQRIPELLQRYNVPIPTGSLKTHLPVPKEEKREAHPSQPTTRTIDDVLAQHGLPWKSSIDRSYVVPDQENGLFYMPFFDWQIQFMKDNLTNLKVLPTESQDGEDLTYIESTTTAAGGSSDKSKQQPVRMVTLCFQSDEYRKIRMTLYDAGNKTQVFTSLFYPALEYNLPVLGVDLLQFNLDRHLCVVDFQPIMDLEEEHAQSYEHLLQPIRDRYPSLQGQMTKRFYDESRHFSNQMLYSRFEELHGQQQQQKQKQQPQEEDEEHPAYRDLFPAYQEYVQTHLSLIQSTPPSVTDIPKVQQGQADYDTYSADRDPAHAMFHRVFGPKFADAFVYDVLFSFSEGTERT